MSVKGYRRRPPRYNGRKETGPRQSSTIRLPSEGNSLRINLAPDSNGARFLVLKNWKGARYYIDFHYKTAYNQKVQRVGWIATDGSDWELHSNQAYNDVISRLKKHLTAK